jgi:hypothetical protein
MNFPQGVLIHIYAKGCMDENGMKLWLEKVWSERIDDNKRDG